MEKPAVIFFKVIVYVVVFLVFGDAILGENRWLLCLALSISTCVTV